MALATDEEIDMVQEIRMVVAIHMVQAEEAVGAESTFPPSDALVHPSTAPTLIGWNRRHSG